MSEIRTFNVPHRIVFDEWDEFLSVKRKLKPIVPEERTIDQWTSKERASWPKWLYSFAVNAKENHVRPLLSWKEYRERMKLLAEVKRYRREMKRETILRQFEMFPDHSTK